MLFLLPIRAKNPPERRPVATLSLIAINVIVFLFTCDGLMSVKQSAVDAMAVSHSHLTLLRLLTSMFLHGSLLHIAGNMWFLWIFGSAVEGRIGPWKFLAVYFACGLVGSLLHDMVIGWHNPDQPTLGASGAIMGIAGTYLYTFPYAPIRLFWMFWLRFGMTEWHARWVVLYFLGLDVLEGVIMRSDDGVAHLVHIGGFATGILAGAVLQVKRDTEDFSAAQAARADVKDPELLSIIDLETLLQQPTDNMRLVLAYCEKALTLPGVMGEQKCAITVQRYLRPLCESADTRRMARILLRLSLEYTRSLPSVAFLRLGSKLQHEGSFDYAVGIYKRITEAYPQSVDAEVSLYRLGKLFETVLNDAAQARFAYSELLRRFPDGNHAEEIRHACSALPDRLQ